MNVDESRREQTRVDENRRKQTKVDQSVDESKQKQTKTDESREKQTKADKSRRKKTKADKTGRKQTRSGESRRKSMKVDESRRKQTPLNVADESRRKEELVALIVCQGDQKVILRSEATINTKIYIIQACVFPGKMYRIILQHFMGLQEIIFSSGSSARPPPIKAAAKQYGNPCIFFKRCKLCV